MESSSRLGLLRRSPSFAYLFLATAGSSIGTYLAAVALTVDVYDRTEETGRAGVWVAALLIADFLPIVLIGLLLGPLVDRLSRRRLMIASDLARFGVFAALALLPFADSPEVVVGLAAISGIATGFFVPAAVAGLPNLVPDDELTNANSLIVTIETLAAMIGPVLGGVMLALWKPDVPYAVNAITFLASAALIARIPRHKLQSDESLSRGHWRDVADGLRLVVTARPLRTVLVVWNVVILGAAAVNVAEVVFAKEELGAGNLGFGALVAASGVGLVLGSFLAPNALAKGGLRRAYVSSIVLMGVGWGAAALSPTIELAVLFVIGGATGNGAAVVCNRLLVQRGAPDQYRGRALVTIMSSNYAVLGLGMAAAGVLTDAFGARTIWIAAGCIYLSGAFVALVMTRWLPASQADEWEAVEVSSESAVAALGYGEANGLIPEPAPGRAASVPEPEPEPAPLPAANGGRSSGLERIATLLEEIEARREREALRRSGTR